MTIKNHMNVNDVEQINGLAGTIRIKVRDLEAYSV